MISLDQARIAKEKILTLDIADVNGVGITKVGEDYAIKLNVTKLSESIPVFIDDVAVITSVVGKIVKQ